MRRAATFLAVLLFELGLLALAGNAVIGRTIAGWFERELRLRCDLAIQSARRSPVAVDPAADS